MTDYNILRSRMVEEQLISRGISDRRVLDAFLKVERHKFMAQELWMSAYADHPLPIGDGQTISQPYMVALMSECLELKGQERVLEIGTGSGFQTAILAELAKEVYSVERFSGLAQSAEDKLNEFGYTNIKIKVGDGTLGWEELSPFDRIIVTAGAPKIPLPLEEQLAEAGKLVIPLGESFSQMLTVVEKKNGLLEEKPVSSCVFVPLIGKFGWGE